MGATRSSSLSETLAVEAGCRQVSSSRNRETSMTAQKRRALDEMLAELRQEREQVEEAIIVVRAACAVPVSGAAVCRLG